MQYVIPKEDDLKFKPNVKELTYIASYRYFIQRLNSLSFSFKFSIWKMLWTRRSPSYPPLRKISRHSCMYLCWLPFFEQFIEWHSLSNFLKFFEISRVLLFFHFWRTNGLLDPFLSHMVFLIFNVAILWMMESINGKVDIKVMAVVYLLFFFQTLRSIKSSIWQRVWLIFKVLSRYNGLLHTVRGLHVIKCTSFQNNWLVPILLFFYLKSDRLSKWQFD